eukprot:jgi/Chlat1/1369/Chrsp119S01767
MAAAAAAVATVAVSHLVSSSQLSSGEKRKPSSASLALRLPGSRLAATTDHVDGPGCLAGACHFQAQQGVRNSQPVVCCSTSNGASQPHSNNGGHAVARQLSEQESELMRRVVELADSSQGLSAPHPNHGCLLIQRDAYGSPSVVGEGFLYAQGTSCAELQAVNSAQHLAKGSTAYVNLEPCVDQGDTSALDALLEADIKRVVIGLRHPLPHLRGRCISALRSVGVAVEVLGEEISVESGSLGEVALDACREVNAALLYRVLTKRPFSVLKYAMTLDGKIASTTGHAAWVSSPASRGHVFETRARSDAVIVGGNTLRRDNPRLTTRREGGHQPIRIVMSRTMELPEEANMWDVSQAPTIVMTETGTREEFQNRLRAHGVEVVTFKELTPSAVMEYCYMRGFLQVLWECGGTLSAPAIADGVIHRVLAFIAPKIVGGVKAPQPVGDLNIQYMYNALSLSDVVFNQVGPDMMVNGYLLPLNKTGTALVDEHASEVSQRTIAHLESLMDTIRRTVCAPTLLPFYKAWDQYGALSNFSAHPIRMQSADGREVEWRSVEHYYQAQKFAGSSNPLALDAIQQIRECLAPEEAARIGRKLARLNPELVRPNWDVEKEAVMHSALLAKFSTHPGPKAVLLATGGHSKRTHGTGTPTEPTVIEVSPHDYEWGSGRDGTGRNLLGKLLTRVRDELLAGNAVHASAPLHSSAQSDALLRH